MKTIGAAVLVFVSISMPAFADQAAAGKPSETRVQDVQDVQELTATYSASFHAGRTANAISEAEQALAAAEQLYSPEDEHVAQVLNDLGHFRRVHGDFAVAEALHRRALAIRDRVFHSDGPSVVQSLNNLAKVYVAQGRFVEAAPLYQRSLPIMERNLPPMHPHLLQVLEQYEDVLRHEGKSPEADPIIARMKLKKS